jgi:hypothetical protein
MASRYIPNGISSERETIINNVEFNISFQCIFIFRMVHIIFKEKQLS